MIALRFLLVTISTLSCPFAFSGGISGGGGNLIVTSPPKTPLSPESIESLVENQHATVKTYFLDKEKSYHQNLLLPVEIPLFEKIFSASKSIHQTVRYTAPDLEDDHPCYDRFNKPVDGSIYTEDPREICISTFQIAQKVQLHEVPAQSAALMIHEYSELAGLSEEEAIVLQNQAFKELK